MEEAPTALLITDHGQWGVLMPGRDCCWMGMDDMGWNHVRGLHGTHTQHNWQNLHYEMMG